MIPVTADFDAHVVPGGPPPLPPPSAPPPQESGGGVKILEAVDTDDKVIKEIAEALSHEDGQDRHADLRSKLDALKQRLQG
eukprot:2712113-Heterocapsa_arctica.AAC.1